MRAFIAACFDDAALDRIVDLQSALSQPMNAAGYKPTPRQNLHLTLAFIPELNEMLICALEQSLKNASLKPATLPYLKTEPLWQRLKSQVLTALFWPEPHLMEISDTVRNVLDQHKVEYDRRPLKPHITLGRARKDVTRQRWMEVSEDVVLPTLPDLRIHGLKLVQSELSPQGSRYTTHFEISFKEA